MTTTREQQILSLAGIVHATARRYPGDRDDLTQAAWEGAIHAVDQWDGRGTLTGYAWLTVQREVQHHLRRANGKNGHRASTLVQLHDIHPCPNCQIETAAARIDINRALQTLRPRDRAVVRVACELGPWRAAELVGLSYQHINRLVRQVRAAAA